MIGCHWLTMRLKEKALGIYKDAICYLLCRVRNRPCRGGGTQKPEGLKPEAEVWLYVANWS